MNKITIVKIGGKVVDDPDTLTHVLKSFAQIEGHKILVHGGGKIASAIGKKLGVEPQMHEGRRITDAETLEVVTMVYGGLTNKKIVAQLQSLSVNAIGLTGADFDIIRSVKRPANPIDFGFVGDVEKVDGARIATLVEAGSTPVFAALTHDGQGSMLNTNADTIAAEVAVACSQNFEVELAYCFEKNGVLADAEDDNSVIPAINAEKHKELLASGVISEGMIPKMHNCFDALNRGVSAVKILHAQNLSRIADDFGGTTITIA